MCGIAGVLKRTSPVGPVEHAELGILLEAMRHRGPDARAVRSFGGWALLGANRLRITDAQNRADMPLLGADGRSAIVFNGEIYNHRELRRELATYPFRTASDTECILAAYRRWGRAAVGHLEGMFAFALYDAHRNEVFIASDPTGQKTLYLWEDEEHLVFASELDALVTDPYRPKHLDLDALAEFVAQRFILGRDTHLREIQKLEAGTWLSWSRASREAARYHHAPRGDLSREDAHAIAAGIRAAVIGSSRSAFDVEVPHALLLSGGIDSATVLALARTAGLRPSTFSIGFTADGVIPQQRSSVCDELPLARRLARELETEHTEITLSAEAYCEALDRWTEIAGEPLGSQEAPCLLRLFESASGSARVVFCGSGPDELFDGYSYGARLAGTPISELPSRYASTFHWAGEADFERLMPGRSALQSVANKLERLLEPYRDWPLDAVHAVQLLHFHGRLGAYEFRQLDLTSMRQSIEARSPLATRALLRVAFDTASRWLHHGGEEKWIYKRALTGVVPPEVVRRKKLGFPIPSELWRSRPFTERAQILFEPGAHLTGCGLIDATYLRTLWDSPSPATRNLFSRLYTAERILRRQAGHCGRQARG